VTTPPPDAALTRGTELIGLPLVAITTGDALADIKDVLYDPDQGALIGFTLNKRGGLFAGPLKHPVPLVSVRAIGRDAIMVDGDGVLDESRADGDAAKKVAAAARNVLGNEVLTDAGERLGTVTDLIVATGRTGSAEPGGHRVGEVVGYEFTADATMAGREGADLLVPLPQTLAVSGTHLVVPASVGPYIRDDLTGFGTAVRDFRAQLADTTPEDGA
jgi:uncharacterized protein YrrD